MKIIVLAATILLVGCTTVSVQEKPISINELMSLKGKTLSLTKRQTIDFYKFTDKLLKGGLIGYSTAKNLGNKFAKENGINDPAFDINTKLAIALQEKYGIVQNNKTIQAYGDKVEEITTKSLNTNLILDFQTTYFGIGHSDEKCFFCSKDYVVYFEGGNYSAKIVLIDVESKSIIAETGCSINLTKETDEKMPLEKVTANNAELLKALFAKASDDCMSKVKTELFAIKQ